MTTIDMAGDAQPFFHDFLGMAPNGEAKQKQQPEISGFCFRNGSRHASGYEVDGETSVKSSPAMLGCPENSVCSAPARLNGGPSPLGFADPSCSSRESERLYLGKSRGIQSHGTKSAFHRPDADGKSVGKKRDGQISNGVDLLEDHRLHMTLDRTETTRTPKMAKFEAREDRGGKQRDVDDLHLAMQPPKPASSCPTLVQPSVSKPDSIPSKRWESQSLYGPSRLSKLGGYDEKISCTATADNGTMPSPFARPAADEGSRTGLQGSSIANLINNGAWTTTCKTTGVPVVSGSRSKIWSQGAGSDPLLPPSRQIGAPASSQLTIFYGGQAHVFDDVSSEKADEIIGLAGSSGRSWSTTYSPQTRSSLQPSAAAPFAGPSTTQHTSRSLQESG
uniref:Tify domain-containing protein n=1 Tax=Araucaria cunninghamii TaxID=56994 RepID=A0A0D6QZE9_ARACU